MKFRVFIVVFTLVAIGSSWAGAQYRFPMPEFESGYQRPEMESPPPKLTSPVVDVVLLAGLMALTAYAVLKLRSRNLVLVISVVSLLYFGFYRYGCVCPVGATQNVFNILIGDGTPVPLLVSIFFLLPLLFALYFGRVFCAAVCPLGAIQEVCAVQPVQIPRTAEVVLGMFAYAYLGLAMLGLYTGTGFLICRYDPFVGFFRQGGSFNMLIAGGVLLVIGIFIARPYCRFLCPYGVLLRWVSIFSRWHASVTPAECIQCRLCETSCPYHAINLPVPETRPETRRVGARRLGWLLAAIPLVVAVSAIAGMLSHSFLARLHPVVLLAERVAAEERGEFSEYTIESEAFRASQDSSAALYSAAESVRLRFKTASTVFGGFMGLAFCGRLIRLSVIRKSAAYETDRGACLSCGRCFDYCPVEKNYDVTA
jgi:ferredoxin